MLTFLGLRASLGTAEFFDRDDFGGVFGVSSVRFGFYGVKPYGISFVAAFAPLVFGPAGVRATFGCSVVIVGR